MPISGCVFFFFLGSVGGCGFVPVVGLGLCRSLWLVFFFFFFCVEVALADVYLCRWWMWVCTGGGFGFVPISLVVFFFFFKAPVVAVGVCAGGGRW